jgi:hypothetical protein
MRVLDIICWSLAALVLLSYVWRRFTANRHRRTKLSTNVNVRVLCNIEDTIATGTQTHGTTLPRAAPFCNATTAGKTNACVAESIHGVGLFATQHFGCGEPIAIVLDVALPSLQNLQNVQHMLHIPQVTPLGHRINHCPLKYNTRIIPEVASTEGSHLRSRTSATGRWILVATEEITQLTEFTTDYNDLPWFLWQPMPWWYC